jgi:hypothetical protein
MDDARRFEDVEVDCLRTLHEAATAAGHQSRFARIGDGAAWAIESEPAIALVAALGLTDDPIREIDLAEGFFESARVPGRFEVASIAHPGLATEPPAPISRATRTASCSRRSLRSRRQRSHTVEADDDPDECAPWRARIVVGELLMTALVNATRFASVCA